MPSNLKLFLALIASLVAALSGNKSHGQEVTLLPSLEKVSSNSLTTLTKKQWPVFFASIQSELKDRWKLKIERVNAPAPTVTENSIDVSFTSQAKPYSHVNVYLHCSNTAEQAARRLRKKGHEGLRRLLSSYAGFHQLHHLGDEAYAYAKPETTIVGRSGNVTFEVHASNQALTLEIVQLIVFYSESATPKILDPDVNDADKASYAARLVADYALTLEGVKQVNEAGRVTKSAGEKWNVQYDKLARQVTVHVLSKHDIEFKRLDTNTNGLIDHIDYSVWRSKILKTYRDSADESDKLKEAAGLLRRIDRRIETLKGDYAELSHWNEPIKTIKYRSSNHVKPDPKSSGKLLQFDLMDFHPQHRLVYYSQQNPCRLKIRVVAAATRNLTSVMPPYSHYARAWLFVDRITAEEKLRKALIRIIQDEIFKEPGPAGIGERAGISATALAHFAETNQFPDLRWVQPNGNGIGNYATVMRDEKQLIFLCEPTTRKAGYNPMLPVAVKITHLPKDANKRAQDKRRQASPGKGAK